MIPQNVIVADLRLEQKEAFMFSCARVRDNLIIQINFKKAVIGVSVTVFVLVLMLWLGWVVVVKIEAKRLREEISQSMSVVILSAIQQSFDKNHSTLLRLENCQAKLSHAGAVSSDLAKMVGKNLLGGNEEVDLPPKPPKSRPR